MALNIPKKFVSTDDEPEAPKPDDGGDPFGENTGWVGGTGSAESRPKLKVKKALPKMTAQHQDMKHPEIKPVPVSRGLHTVLLGG